MFYPKSPFNNRLVETHLIKGNLSAVNELLPWLCLSPKITTYRINLLLTTVEAFKAQLEQLLAKKYKYLPAIFTIPQVPEVLCIGPVPHENTDDPLQYNPEQKQIIVDSCCAAAVLRGAHIYAPGVLAMETGTKQLEEVQVFADLEGKCKKGTNTRYESLQKVFLGQGVVRMQRYQLYGENAKSEGVAIEMMHSISDVPSIGDLSGRDALLQNFPSIVCARVLDPQPGEVVLDMCSAPGNKTTHIAELMRDQGVLVALDKSESKIKYVREKLALYGLQSVRPFAYDARNACDGTENCDGDLAAQPPFAAATFDRILLDAPCSALGNRPLLANNTLKPKMLDSYPLVQRRLFAAAVQLLKPGGVLVYSTCSITGAENESLVQWALEKHPQLQLVAALPKFGGDGLPDLGLTDEHRCLVQRFGPANTNTESCLDTVGFFIAKFKKLL